MERREKQIKLFKDIISDIKETIKGIDEIRDTVNDIEFSDEPCSNEIRRVSTFLTMCGARRNSEELLRIYEERLKKLEIERIYEEHLKKLGNGE